MSEVAETLVAPGQIKWPSRLRNPLVSIQFRLKTTPGNLPCARPRASPEEQNVTPVREEFTAQEKETGVQD